MVKDMIDQQKIDKIQTAIKKKGRGLSLTELVKETGLSKNTINKHVSYLLGGNSVIFDICGNNKLVCLNKSPREIKEHGS